MFCAISDDVKLSACKLCMLHSKKTVFVCDGTAVFAREKTA